MRCLMRISRTWDYEATSAYELSILRGYDIRVHGVGERILRPIRVGHEIFISRQTAND